MFGIAESEIERLHIAVFRVMHPAAGGSVTHAGKERLEVRIAVQKIETDVLLHTALEGRHHDPHGKRTAAIARQHHEFRAHGNVPRVNGRDRRHVIQLRIVAEIALAGKVRPQGGHEFAILISRHNVGVLIQRLADGLRCVVSVLLYPPHFLAVNLVAKPIHGVALGLGVDKLD